MRILFKVKFIYNNIILLIIKDYENYINNYYCLFLYLKSKIINSIKLNLKIFKFYLKN